MSDEFRPASIFVLGTKIEAMKEVHEETEKTSACARDVCSHTISALEKYRDELLLDMKASRLTVKESEYAQTYVSKCIDVVRRLQVDAESRRLQSSGAVDALNRCVSLTKEAYDLEFKKMNEQKEIDENPSLEAIKNRSVGVNPGNPLDVYKSNKFSKKKSTR